MQGRALHSRSPLQTLYSNGSCRSTGRTQPVRYRISAAISEQAKRCYPTPQLFVSCVNAENIADDASSQNMPISGYACCQSDTLRRNTIDLRIEYLCCSCRQDCFFEAADCSDNQCVGSCAYWYCASRLLIPVNLIGVVRPFMTWRWLSSGMQAIQCPCWQSGEIEILSRLAA